MKNNFLDRTQKILYIIIALCTVLSIISGLYVARALEPYKMKIQFLEQEIKNHQQINDIKYQNIGDDIKDINNKLEIITKHILKD